MHTETVKVAYVNAPKPGRKTGSIKTDDGRYFSVWPEKLALFSPGATVTIDYTSEEGSDGRTYHTIKKVAGSAPGPVRRPNTNGMASATTGKPSHTTAEEMFVMGLIGRAIHGTGAMPDRETLTLWVEDIRAAWYQGFRAADHVPPTAGTPPFDDPIPF